VLENTNIIAHRTQTGSAPQNTTLILHTKHWHGLATQGSKTPILTGIFFGNIIPQGGMS